ncbi:PHP domain-containing protein [Mammaliicoccus sciuri]|uniref:PHP domain-containing protein n=1 Tax=Mammaliicoccus sciuri TaxID=1296 RepID=UPI001FB416B2|nr:PHP domain-containing protein [Mammaliicoccus sciuri]MCJ1749352.1 PHP domain-containing protein [Mammaliicoccus sciuri]
MVGNKWYKCDLHLHSPASECFRDKTVTAEQWIAECKEKGLDCVALTDHNTGENIDEYKEEAYKNDIILFPGVELTCGESKTHLLVLFDRNSGKAEVEDFILKMGIERDKMASSEANSPKSVIEVINFAEENGLIVIPAHIDEYNGLSSLSYQARENVFNATNVSSVQVVQKEFFEILDNGINGGDREDKFSEVKERYSGIGEDTFKSWFKTVREAREKEMNFLTFSDNPHEKGDSRHGLWGIGQRYTYIKMKENPDIFSLRDALMLGKERTYADFSEFQNNRDQTIINTLAFSGTTLSTQEITVDFSGNLSTIIGGRGTGKSCITRLLFYVLGKEDILNDFSEIEAEYKNFSKMSDGESGILTENTIVNLEVFYNGTKYKIVRTPKLHQVFSIDDDGNEVLVSKERLNMISSSITLYMQKQIYEISKNQKSILNLLDTFNSSEISAINSELENYKNEILKINLDNDDLINHVGQKGTVELKIEDLRKKERKLTNKEIKEIFENNKEVVINKKLFLMI